MSEWKDRAEAVRGDPGEMLQFVEEVYRSPAATPMQISAATSARSSLKLLVQRGPFNSSELRIDVANRRYEKLVLLL